MRNPPSTFACSVHVTGIVQGVGFRPFVFNLAREHGISGWVLNGSDGVRVHAQGDEKNVRRFVEEISGRAPRMARIDGVCIADAASESFDSFEIRHSVDDAGAMTLVSPDIATCPDCLRELFDPNDRRYRYPFINCTNCGPRFTIIESIPYDRPLTSMKGFELCAPCEVEYRDPADRRFHAQPNACFECGPRLYLTELAVDLQPEERCSQVFECDPRAVEQIVDSERRRSDEVLSRTVELLRSGAVVAIKGIGGYHLCCDALDDTAVARLRERKHRWGKPLAIMVRDAAAVREYCEMDEAEQATLEGPTAPIVLLRKRPGGTALASGVADALSEVGVVLPYTPLQHLLIRAFGSPLVMTSGNVSDEPIATDDFDARARLSGIADALLSNDRKILARYDDSVVRVIDGNTVPVRRARGLAPFPLPLPAPLSTEAFSVLGVGPEQKTTFCLTRGSYAFVSQHIGDLENVETFDAWVEAQSLYKRLFRIDPDVIAHDLHPEYLSTKWALASGMPLEGVQHHHAHIAAICAEHGLCGPVVGLAFDGTGYGEDGRIWGGEVLIADLKGYERVAHLRYLPLPGGAAAVRRPLRTALGMLIELDLLDHPGARSFMERQDASEVSVVTAMVERSVNTPRTSSMGRLFDAVSALVGITDDSRYEGEAAILLEATASPVDTGSYRFDIDHSASPEIIDPEPVIRALLDDMHQGVGIPELSARFHNAVCDLVVEISSHFAERGGRTVALGGGVFMNRRLLGSATRALADKGFITLTPRMLPVNDGAVSYGQAVVALARRLESFDTSDD